VRDLVYERGGALGVIIAAELEEEHDGAVCVARLAPLQRGASEGIGAAERRRGKRRTVLADLSMHQ
jgi:hypothetical protein